MFIITGELDRIIERQAGNADNQWTERTLALKAWGSTHYATLVREFVAVPDVGTRLAVEVSVRAYVAKDNRPGFELRALRAVPVSELEAELGGSVAGLRAAG